MPSWLLAGEVCRVNVEVFNCGQVALNSLRLASSLSQHLLLEEVHIYIYIHVHTSVLVPRHLTRCSDFVTYRNYGTSGYN